MFVKQRCSHITSQVMKWEHFDQFIHHELHMGSYTYNKSRVGVAEGI